MIFGVDVRIESRGIIQKNEESGDRDFSRQIIDSEPLKVSTCPQTGINNQN
jgi:hypothetical protein